MDVNLDSNESLVGRIKQLEHERDELRKDIEQLCMQQAGPGYLVVATKLHFQRTASLEQEIENLKKKLADCTRENNMEAEKQVQFFQGCVAYAFAERDHSIMEAAKAKENEELMSQKFNDFQNRLEELSSDCLEQKTLNDVMKNDLAKQEEQNETYKKIVNKFYKIREHSLENFGDTSWDHKCACLLHDSSEIWSYNDASTSKYISALEEELEKVRKSGDNLQSKLQVGLEIENHLKKRAQELENKQIRLGTMIVNSTTELRQYYSQHRVDIMNLLNEERSHMKSVVNMIEEKVAENDGLSHKNINCHKNKSRDVELSKDSNTSLLHKESINILSEREDNMSGALSQATQEKISALLLLSQQEERHLLERNVNAALQKKVEELQRNLLQVTNEKVKALMDLAQLKQEYQQFQEKSGQEIQQGNSPSDTKGKTVFPYDRDGRLRNILNKTYLKRWVGKSEEGQINSEGDFSSKRFNNMDFERIKIEYATLKGSMESMDHLTSSIRRLRLALLKAKESIACQDTDTSITESLSDIIYEAKLLKTALGSSLPIIWTADMDATSDSGSLENAIGDYINSGSKMDSVNSVGFEMVELLILASQILQQSLTRKDVQDGS